jgi:hypothetical protein
MTAEIIKCNTVKYRQGYIEVSQDIHPGCINIETWDVHPDLDISSLSVRDYEFPDEFVDAEGKTVDSRSGNVELELNIDQAKHLVHLLQQAIAAEESKSNEQTS